MVVSSAAAIKSHCLDITTKNILMNGILFRSKIFPRTQLLRPLFFFTEQIYKWTIFLKNQQQIIVLLESRAGSAQGCCERGVWQLELSDKISESREYFKFSLSTLFPHRLRPSPARSLYCSGELSAEISQKLNLI